MKFESCTGMFRTSLSPQKLPVKKLPATFCRCGQEMLRRSLMRAAANEYRAKAFERSLAECVNDAERRAEFLRYARWWMQLAEPVGSPRSAYEVEPQHNRWQQILRHQG